MAVVQATRLRFYLRCCRHSRSDVNGRVVRRNRIRLYTSNGGRAGPDGWASPTVPVYLASRILNSDHIRWIERHVVKRFKEENRNVRCKNASRGGERISTPFNEIFFYIAASDKLGIDGLDN